MKIDFQVKESGLAELDNQNLSFDVEIGDLPGGIVGQIVQRFIAGKQVQGSLSIKPAATGEVEIDFAASEEIPFINALAQNVKLDEKVPELVAQGLMRIFPNGATLIGAATIQG